MASAEMELDPIPLVAEHEQEPNGNKDKLDNGTSQTKYAEEKVIEQIVDLLKDVSKTTATLDTRFSWRALRQLSVLRQNSILTQETLTVLFSVVYPENSSYKKNLLKYLNKNHKSVVANADAIRYKYPASFYQVNAEEKTLDVSAEINCFMHLLLQIHFLDEGDYATLTQLNRKVIVPHILCYYNLRTLDLINAKLWFYVVMGEEFFHEASSKKPMSNEQYFLQLRSEMIKYLKNASLKHDNETKAMLINLILRRYLKLGEIESASEFVSKVDFPSTDVSSPLEARYFFYLSKILALQLDYSSANEYIIAAIRKAPQTKKSVGFIQQANKLHCVIQLLMGDIPELSFFHQKDLQQSLVPYYNLAKAVKLGDLKKFTSTISKFQEQLVHDGNYQLCVRLRSNVIKTGIRIISLTYKRIYLKDICLKLHLDSEQTTEYMVSRAIRDGVIDATINHVEGYIESREVLNIYNSTEPQSVFDERIKFVNQLHDESVMSMRFPKDKKKKHNNGASPDDKMLEDEILDEISDISDIDDLGFL